jgi:thymidylate kinase
MSRPYRLALAGIDGSGKTSVVTRLRQVVGVESDVVTVHSPSFHENSNAPLGELSRQMREMSLIADDLQVFGLKVSMLYLQMTLYGTVERSLVDAFVPTCVVSDRHPLLDTLAYGTIYKRLATEPLDRATVEPLVRERLSSPAALDTIVAWHERVQRRLGGTTGFWELSDELAGVFAGSWEAILAEFSRRYTTQLPDSVVLLDVDPDEALRRSSARAGRSSELHEDLNVLEALRDVYDEALGIMEVVRPDVEIHRVPGTELSLEETLSAVLACVPPSLTRELSPGLV